MNLFAELSLGEAQHHESLTLFPLVWSQPHEPPYVLLGKAIESGQAVVEEINESGRVPNLAVTNKADRPLLIPEGEILIGAKQNRVVNVTVLVAAGTKFVLPVSCVEAGRWSYNSRQFTSKYCAPPSLRSKKLQAVQKNRADYGEAQSDQGEVWNEVSACLASVGAQSPSDSLSDGFDFSKDKLDAYRQALPLPADAAGVLVASGDRVIGLDLFDSPATLHALWGRLCDAYCFGDRPPSPPAVHATAQAFLDGVSAASHLRPSAIGLGDELEIASENLVGAALLYRGNLCHLSAFSVGV